MCFADLHDALVGTFPGSCDDWAWRTQDGDAYRQAKVATRQRLGSDIGNVRVHREAMRIIAEHAIRLEIRSGRLPLWVMFDDVPHEMDHHGWDLIDRQTLTLGWIHPTKNPPSCLKDRPIWILLSDWRAFKQRFMSSREGIEWSEAKSQCAPFRSKDSIRPFNNYERLQWIRDQPSMSADAAFRLYRLAPRYDGTKQTAFRADWRNERKTTRGRPRK